MNFPTPSTHSMSWFLVFVSVSVFFAFGCFHLSKFETVDEHFWKYERVGQYFDGWKSGLSGDSWKKTYINDKPGVTVALASGIGLLFSDPDEHRIRDDHTTENNRLTLYRTEKTELLNRSLRLPILIFNAFALIALFFILKSATRSHVLASITTALLAGIPAILGISQIINPDALFWTFSAGTIFSYLALLRTGDVRFVVLTGVFAGLSLLSKYTGSVLFALFPLMFLSSLLFSDDAPDFSRPAIAKKARGFIIHFIGISAIACVVFAVLLPASIEYPKYLLRGTVDSPVAETFRLPLLAILLSILGDLAISKGALLSFAVQFFRKHTRLIIGATAIIPLALMLTAYGNGITGGSVFSLDNIREDISEEGRLVFPEFSDDPMPVAFFKKMVAETTPLAFSLPPVLLFALILAWTLPFWKKSFPFSGPYIAFSIFIPLYLAGALASDEFVNPRYGIILYPIVSIIGAIGVLSLLESLKKKFPAFSPSLFPLAVAIILASSILTFFSIRPFYLNYENPVIPKSVTVMDSWGYGAYEAAEYLNSLPNADSTVIWADRSGICQFFHGKCLKSYKIDPASPPDYFVFSRRGAIRHPFIWKTKSTTPPHPTEYYYTKTPEWSLSIEEKPDNYIKIVRVSSE